MTREEAIELLEDVIGFVEDNQKRDYDTAFRMAIEALKGGDAEMTGTQPYMQQSRHDDGRPSGEWIIRENGNKECSLCGHERRDGWDCFCGYCGAKMKGGAE